MRVDKKLKKKIQKEFENPRVPFDEWARQHNIMLDKREEKPVSVAQYEVAPAVQTVNQGNMNVKKGATISIFCLLAVGIIATSIIIPLMFTQNNLPLYGSGDIKSVHMELDDLLAIDGIYVFDTNKLVDAGQISKDVLIDDDSFTLCYNIKDCLVMIDEESTIYVFYVSYKILVYEHYEFLYYSNYENLKNAMTVGDKNIKYSLNDSMQYPTGYAQFAFGDNSYYLEVKGVDGITDLALDNLEILLKNLFA